MILAIDQRNRLHRRTLLRWRSSRIFTMKTDLWSTVPQASC